MMLLENWKLIVKKAQSFRLMALAGILSGVEVVLPLFIDSFPRYWFAGMSFFVTCAAMWARLVAQPKMYAPGAKK